MLDLPPAAESVVRVALIAIATLVAILLLRKGVELGVRGVLERRRSRDDEGAATDDVEKRMRTVARLATRVGAAVLITIAVLMALTEFGVEIGPAVAGLGVVGLAVGFGAQWLIRDWLAGIFVVLEGQYSVGDIVSIAGVNGVVEEFSLRRTMLRGLDGTIHVVPNGQVTVASNLTKLWRRVTLELAVPADADAGRATELVNRAGASMKEDPEWGQRVLEAPSVVRVAKSESAPTQFTVLAVVHTAERSAVVDELRGRIEEALTADRISLVAGDERSAGDGDPVVPGEGTG